VTRLERQRFRQLHVRGTRTPRCARFTHHRPEREHVRHVLAHFADGGERDGIPADGTGHPHGVRVQPDDRGVHDEPDNGRGRLPRAAHQHLRAHVGDEMTAAGPAGPEEDDAAPRALIVGSAAGRG